MGAGLALIACVYAADLPPQTIFMFGGRTVHADSDSDGMGDAYESAHGLDMHDPGDASQDLDGDGLSNAAESLPGTNPWSSDSDGDGVADADERTHGLNPLASDDTDADGLRDDWERFFFGSLQHSPSDDFDGDSVSNWAESTQGTDPSAHTLTDHENQAGLIVSSPAS